MPIEVGLSSAGGSLEIIETYSIGGLKAGHSHGVYQKGIERNL